MLGGAGNDTLQGGVMRGGTGDDLYRVDSYRQTGSLSSWVIEDANGGSDKILLTAMPGKTAWMTDHVESLEVLNYRDVGPGGVQVRGNALDNHISGNMRSDTLWGGEGHDTIQGYGGHDQLWGDAGNDLIDGGAGGDTILAGIGDDTVDGGNGADEMRGGAGNDIFLVGAGDVVIEHKSEGKDTVRTDLGTYTLNANIEGLEYTGGGNFDATGNAGHNTIRGAAGNDILRGGDGYDELFGGNGNDNISGGNGHDKRDGDGGADYLNGGAGTDELSGGEGNDTLHAGADGSDWMMGNDGRDRMRGDAGRDTMDGGAGNDRLEGGADADLLTGGYGADTFVFRYAADSSAAAADTITDFLRGVDRIDLSLVDADGAGIAGNGAFRFLGGGQPFFGSPGDLWVQAQGADSLVRGDVNGDGLADLQILVQGVTGLSASDFIL